MGIGVAQLEWLLSVFLVMMETERDVVEVMEDMNLVEMGVVKKVNEVREELMERLENGVEEI